MGNTLHNAKELEEQASLIECSGLGTKLALSGHPSTILVDLSKLENQLPKLNVQKLLQIGFLSPPESDEFFDFLNIQKASSPAGEEGKGNLLYSVNYSVPKKGRYAILITWGDKQVKGSPFILDVV